MSNALEAARAAESALKSERNELVASIAAVNARISAIDAAIDGLRRYGATLPGLAHPDVKPSNVLDLPDKRITHKDAALGVFRDFPDTHIMAADLWTEMQGRGASSKSPDPLNVVDALISELQKAGYPIIRVGKRTFMWDSETEDEAAHA